MQRLFFITICFLYSASPTWCEDVPAQVKRPIEKSIQTRQKTQKAEDRWYEEKTRLEAEFKTLQEEQKRFVALKNELNKKVESSTIRIETMEHRITEISRISQELIPYLEQVYNRLAALVENDPPFLREERQNRIKNLRKVLDDDQVSASEKFRKMTEALFVEAEYGNTVEVYQQRIVVDEKDILANIFRLGRLSLFFQSLDQATTGYFDPALSVWKTFPKAFNREINKAIEMGGKRRSVDLLTLPIGRIVAQ
ncbi:MAG: DUF3450 domain-containing protein [Deltaproteobacteria bacterium]|nr:DUF3450 domain-containing protein [Deltaproteobacteria bacterium]